MSKSKVTAASQYWEPERKLKWTFVVTVSSSKQVLQKNDIKLIPTNINKTIIGCLNVFKIPVAVGEHPKSVSQQV